MIPHFTNTTAFWALLAIPLITALHFLQHKTKTQATATLFLLEALVPEAHEGNAWDRLRASRSFWMQILAVLLLTWVLASPVWPGKGSGQTVVFILDDSANMTPFRQEAVNAVSEDMDAILRSGIPEESFSFLQHPDFLILMPPEVPRHSDTGSAGQSLYIFLSHYKMVSGQSDAHLAASPPASHS